MKQRQFASLARKLNEVADLIAAVDPDLFHAMIVNGCDVAIPQQLRQMAGRFAALADDGNAYSSRIMAMEDNPSMAIWTSAGKTFVP